MPSLAYEHIRSTLAAQPLFEDKTWQLSPEAWPLTSDQHAQLEAIGAACLEFHQALESLYLRSAAGKNLLRNKPLLAPWVADYLDRGKPPALVAHARDPKNRGAFPTVLRPDLLLTDEGFVLTELDSVPGGIGLTAFLNRLYGGASDPAILGHGDAMIRNFHASLAALRPGVPNPLIALVVSDEAATYRPEMEWLAHQLQVLGKRVFCIRPEDIFPLENSLFYDSDGNPEKIDVLYRFFELFDLANVRTERFIFESWTAGEVAIAPPMRPFQEEKLTLALFHHHLLQDFWAEALSGKALKLLRALIPPSWVIDPAPLPPGAVLDGPRVGGRALSDWRELSGASQKERDLIIKISGYHETAWGARSVVLGSDCSREEWQAGVAHAIELAPTNLHLLQAYKKPRRIEHPLYDVRADAAGATAAPVAAVPKAGRLRLCPYYFVIDGRAQLSGALATFCPPDKKIIHGMTDAALLPCRVVATG
ncbi:MAG: hypothetical protein NTV51_24335 [Verrucomicrobia bacterium]|nr:hypothetical protein [Verrucomicrobiota bacterium]